MRRKLLRLIREWDNHANRSIRMGMITQASILNDYVNDLRKVCGLKKKRIEDFSNY